MKRPTVLLQRVLFDVGLQLSDTIDLDYRYICSRYEREGLSFLTITLPSLDDALLRGLSRGHLTRQDFPGFKPRTRGGSLPALLQGFFRRIFHDDGSIRDVPDTCAIFAIRQVTRLFKKVELPCSDARVKAAYERYESNDREVDWRRHRRPYDAGLWASICGYLWSDLEVLSGELYCFPGNFGPGATAERSNRNERHSVRKWPERAEGSFPSSFHAVSREDSESLLGIEYLSPENEEPVRVVQVPKTLKTPRTISVEPSYMMLMQQSVAKPLMAYLESPRWGFRSIRFADQSVNRELARLGSIDGRYATIDLKDASDLVDNDLVTEIFRGPAPTFLQLIQDCRSTRAKMPDGRLLPLRKFASMGSAMCFPVEAMVFFTIVMYAIVEQSGSVPSSRLLRKIARDVAVYGDDIIVPAKMAPVVMERLEDFGLRVNHDKSFHTGLFRESCGGDYYNGVDVTPAYVRQWDETGTLSKSSHKVAYVSLSNTFYMKGLWHASQYLRDFCDSRIGRPLPRARRAIGVLHYHSCLYDTQLAWSKSICGWRVRGLKIRVRSQDDSPCTMDGFLHLSFQSRYHTGALLGIKEQRAGQNAGSLVLQSVGEYLRGGGTPQEAGFLERNVPDEPQLEAHFSRSSSLRCTEEYGWRLDRRNLDMEQSFHGRNRDLLAERLQHLSEAVGTSLYTSERPHALCLKRGWTASHAGITFR